MVMDHALQEADPIADDRGSYSNLIKIIIELIIPSDEKRNDMIVVVSLSHIIIERRNPFLR